MSRYKETVKLNGKPVEYDRYRGEIVETDSYGQRFTLISRYEALERICTVEGFADNWDAESISDRDPFLTIYDFLVQHHSRPHGRPKYENFSNRMLERVLERPFYRRRRGQLFRILDRNEIPIRIPAESKPTPVADEGQESQVSD